MSNSRKTKRRDSDSIDVNFKRIKLSNEDNTEAENNKILNDALLGNISEQVLSVERDLVIELGKITFHSPIEYVYSPLEYAFNIHTMYVQKYCNTIKKILFLGMNPGPWGMSQTGVPFGEISMVRDWLKICGPVGKPVKEQPNRKVTGFQCNRSEISGKRLWGLFQKLCGSPEKFFQQAYIHNYCPIALMKKNGCNITPAEIKAVFFFFFKYNYIYIKIIYFQGSEIQILHSNCDKALLDIIRILKAEIVIGIGGYAEKRAQFVIQSSKLPIKVIMKI